MTVPPSTVRQSFLNADGTEPRGGHRNISAQKQGGGRWCSRNKQEKHEREKHESTIIVQAGAALWRSCRPTNPVKPARQPTCR